MMASRVAFSELIIINYRVQLRAQYLHWYIGYSSNKMAKRKNSKEVIDDSSNASSEEAPSKKIASHKV